MAKKDVMIKDAPLVEVINGAEKIPVSDGSNEPRAVNLQQIKVFVGADTPLSKGQGENSVKQTPPSPTFEKKNELLTDEKGEFIEADALGDYAVALGGTAAAIGKRSVAQGHRCIAEGETSHAEGNCAVVKYIDETLNGYGSHAEGYSTVVVGTYSHAEGSKCIVGGSNSHAEGGETGVEADMAHAEGYQTRVSIDADGAHAEGNGTIACAKYSHAEGRQTRAFGEGSHSEGTGTKALKDYSHSEGKGTKSDGLYSHAEGIDTETNAAGAHAEGFQTLATNECSHAEGHGAVAKGMYSHAEGWVTNAIGEASHAEGQNTRAHQTGSHAEGNNTEAQGAYSHAEGIGTKTKEGIAGQHVEGYYNKETDSLKIIGCGTSDEDRKNAVEVTQDGRVFVKGIGNYDGTSLEAVDVKTAFDHKANSGDVYNKTEMDNRIKADLVQKVEVATINGQSLINGGNIVIEGSATPDWNAKEGEAGYIENKPFYDTINETFDTSLIPSGVTEYSYIINIPEYSGDYERLFLLKVPTIQLGLDEVINYNEVALDVSSHVSINETVDILADSLTKIGAITISKEAWKYEIIIKFSVLENWRYNLSKYIEDTSYAFEDSLASKPLVIKTIADMYLPETIARKSELTELSEEVSGLSERVDDLEQGGGSSVFEAEYGKTTYAQVVEAKNAGKLVYCIKDGRYYTLVELKNNSRAWFVCVSSTYIDRAFCNLDDSWTSETLIAENASNKVKSLSASSTDTQYPSAKAVYEAIQQSGGGGGTSTDKQGVVSQLQGWEVKNGVYSYTMKNVVIGSIPQASIDLFTRVGAVFNEESGYFEMNSLTDISYEEMMDIYTYGNVPTLPNIEQYRFLKEIRTAIPVRANSYYNQNMASAFQYATLESLYFSNESSPVNVDGLCSDTKYIHTLVIPDYSRGKKLWSRMSQLRVCQIAKINANIELPTSKLLTNESVLYMIQNEAATSAITITLHADAYDRAMADAEIQAALAAHPNVSLAK